MKKLYFLIGVVLMLHQPIRTSAQVTPGITVGSGGSLTVGSGAVLRINGNLVTDNGSSVTNNGNIFIGTDLGTGDSYLIDVAPSGTTYVGTGTITMEGTALQNIYGLGGLPLTIPNLVIVNTSAGGVILNGGLEITNILNLTDGVFHELVTATLYVSNPATGAIINGGVNAWIDGLLRREVFSTGTYWFPSGDATYYEPFFLTINSSTGVTSVTVQAVSTLTNPAPNPAITFVNTTPIQDYLDRTQWNMSFTGGGSMNCDVIASEEGATNYPPSANYIALLHYDGVDWHGTNPGGTGGTHANASQSIIAGPIAIMNKTNINLTVPTVFEGGVSLGNALPINCILEGDNKGSVNELRLVASSEEKTKYIVFEKSIDGKVFTVLDTLLAAGYSTVMKVYTATDTNPYATTYYRVRVIDDDATVTPTNIIALRLPEEIPNDLIVVYPNPSIGSTAVHIQTKYSGDCIILVTDMLGRVVADIHQEIGAEIGNTIPITSEQFSAGMYAATVHYGGVYKTMKFVVQK
jgi:hypothetical protein